MSKIISITSKGQLTLPRDIKEILGIQGQIKASIEVVDGAMVIKPKGSFWNLSGSLKSKVVASDKDLQKARDDFSKHWPREQDEANFATS